MTGSPPPQERRAPDRRTVLLGAAAAAAVGPSALTANPAPALPESILWLMNHPAAGFWEAAPPGAGLPLNAPIEDLAGGLGDWRARFFGRPVLLCLWATWCAPCLMEMPGLDALARRLRASPLIFAPVLTSDPSTTLADGAATFERLGVATLTPLRDAAEGNALFFSRLKIAERADGASSGLPTSCLIGPDGAELARTYAAVREDERGERKVLWDDRRIAEFLDIFATAWP